MPSSCTIQDLIFKMHNIIHQTYSMFSQCAVTVCKMRPKGRQTGRQGEKQKASFIDVNCNQGAKIQYTKSKQHKGRQQKVQGKTT